MLYQTPQSETTKILLRAADLIRENGLAKHTRQDEKGGYCIHGAVSMAIYSEPVTDSHKTQAVMTHIGDYMASKNIDYRNSPHSPHWVIAPWSNRPERTAEDVIGVLEGAALFVQETVDVV